MFGSQKVTQCASDDERKIVPAVSVSSQFVPPEPVAAPILSTVPNRPGTSHQKFKGFDDARLAIMGCDVADFTRPIPEDSKPPAPPIDNWTERILPLYDHRLENPRAIQEAMGGVIGSHPSNRNDIAALTLKNIQNPKLRSYGKDNLGDILETRGEAKCKNYGKGCRNAIALPKGKSERKSSFCFMCYCFEKRYPPSERAHSKWLPYLARNGFDPANRRCPIVGCAIRQDLGQGPCYPCGVRGFALWSEIHEARKEKKKAKATHDKQAREQKVAKKRAALTESKADSKQDRVPKRSVKEENLRRTLEPEQVNEFANELVRKTHLRYVLVNHNIGLIMALLDSHYYIFHPALYSFCDYNLYESADIPSCLSAGFFLSVIIRQSNPWSAI